MDITLDNAAIALADSDSLNEEQARAFRAMLYERRVGLDKQLEAIVDPNKSGNDQWQRTLATGTDADLKTLEAEYEGLKRERDRLQAQYNRFANLATVCRQREAASTIPARLVELEASADAVIAARDALDVACGHLETVFQGTSTAYRDATRGGVAHVDAPADELVDKVCIVAKSAGYTPSGPLYGFGETRPHVIRARLHQIDPSEMATLYPASA